MTEYLEGPKTVDMPHLTKDRPKLIREARNLAAKSGHLLGRFAISRIVIGYPPSASRGALTARCVRCGAEINIDPEHGAIFGEILEKDCPSIKKARPEA